MNGNLPIEIEIGENGAPEISIVKQGKGSKKYQEKSSQICDFVANYIDFVYIPAVRTDEHAIDLIRTRFRRILLSLESDDRYRDALNQIQQIQKPLLDQLSDDIGQQLRRFIPTVRQVSIDTSIRRISNSLSSDIEVKIDDGVDTSLESKGDGIKSLVALSLFQSASKSGKFRIIAIEEPESHLHPGAVHELRRVLDKLAEDGQVILSTHSPIFAGRHRLSDVILVENGKAARVKNIDEIRRSLGILVSDNLVNAEFSIVCEGTSDIRILTSLFSSLSPKIMSAISSGTLVFDSLGGSSKLSYKLSSLNRDVFRIYVVMDFDAAGRGAIDDAQRKGLLSVSDYTLLRARGAMDCEIEDMIRSEILRDLIAEHYNVDIKSKAFGGKGKFSDRISAGMTSLGKRWTSEEEIALKTLIANMMDAKPVEKLSEAAAELVNELVASIEQKLAIAG